MAGRVVILNGAPRSGKSSLAGAIQAKVPGTWIIWGVDAFNATLPPHLLPGIGLRPGGERPDLEPEVFRLFTAYFESLAAFARSGLDAVADLGLHSDYGTPFDPAALAETTLEAFNPLWVGIHCDIETIMARRNADPQNGLYLGGPGVPAPVARWQEAVHAGKRYDLDLDMATLSPEEGAAAIGAALERNRTP
jgi:chloramphenicol 3-O phosphotransferase